MIEPKTFYDKSYNYLLERARKLGIGENTESELEKYFDPKKHSDLSCENNIGSDFVKEHDFNSIERVFLHMFVSLQNSGYRNFINNDKFLDIYRETLKDFNPKKVVEVYKNNPDEIGELIYKKQYEEKTEEQPKIWKDFWDGVYHGAKYLKIFDDKEHFVRHLDGVEKQKKDICSAERRFRALMIDKDKKEHKIWGMGVALASDFLKDCGVIDCGKPDRHIIEVLKSTGMIDENKDKDKDIWSVVYDALSRIASAGKCDIYKVDRMIWLICTEKFYLHQYTGDKRKDYISFLLS